MKKLIIFLDFDGVLHPVLCNPEKFFSRREEFENTIRKLENVEIVISSSWRHQYEFEELVNFFSLDIQRLISGCTRSVLESKVTKRYDEIMDYLIHYDREDEEWIAIDDSREEFPENCPNLILCNRHKGFDVESAASLVLTSTKRL